MQASITHDEKAVIKRVVDRLLNLRQGTPIRHLRVKLGQNRKILDHLVDLGYLRAESDQYLPTYMALEQVDEDIRQIANHAVNAVLTAVRDLYTAQDKNSFTFEEILIAVRQVDPSRRALALGELWDLAYGNMAAPAGLEGSAIHIGKSYGTGKKSTEADLSFEGDGFLVLVEAKLYSPMSQADPENDKPHNQIARKLTIGLREAQARSNDFYFILLDIAPVECLAQLKPGASLKEAMGKASGFGGKWLTSYWYSRYKYGHRGSLKPLGELLSKEGLNAGQTAQVAARMGWLTWADVFKVVLRAVIPAQQPDATKASGRP